MEAFAALFHGCAGNAHDPEQTPLPGADTYLVQPMSALSQPPQSLEAVFGPEGNLLLELAGISVGKEPARLCELYTTLSGVIADDAMYQNPGLQRARRLVEYVYPVV